MRTAPGMLSPLSCIIRYIILILYSDLAMSQQLRYFSQLRRNLSLMLFSFCGVMLPCYYMVPVALVSTCTFEEAVTSSRLHRLTSLKKDLHLSGGMLERAVTQVYWCRVPTTGACGGSVPRGT